jgi:hypothetical protein
MGNRLTHGLGGRGHWLDMLGGDEGEVKPLKRMRSKSENAITSDKSRSVNR